MISTSSADVIASSVHWLPNVLHSERRNCGKGVLATYACNICIIIFVWVNGSWSYTWCGSRLKPAWMRRCMRLSDRRRLGLPQHGLLHGFVCCDIEMCQGGGHSGEVAESEISSVKTSHQNSYVKATIPDQEDHALPNGLTLA